MKRKHSVILGALILLIIIYVFACAPAIKKTVTPDRKPEKYRTVFCEDLDKRKKSAYPVNVTDRFIKGNGK
jgi:hypothetical protein